MKDFTCPTKAWIFYSKQRFEHVSDDQSVLHKLLWLQLWLHEWDKIKTTKFGDSGVLSYMLEGARLERIFGLKYKSTLLTGALCYVTVPGEIPERQMIKS